ncbi:MAG: hypothetical protein QOH95_320 [Gaiellaceae bacterium]|jgi:predicted alpha/beta hydrolase family esterase|nr:hypothetical protein [Gaiellaceae bacterium]
MRSRVERWAREHPDANAVLVCLLAAGLGVYAVVKLVQVWTGPVTGLLFATGAVAGALASWLSYQAGVVERWNVSPQMQTALQAMQAVSGVAALVCVRSWGPGWVQAAAAGLVLVLGAWLVPAVVIARRIRLADPDAADELYQRSKDVLG